MNEALSVLGTTLRDTILALLPIVVLIAVFQRLVIRQRLAEIRSIAVGFALVLVGMVLFITGLENALFPLGRAMAQQLTDPAFLGVGDAAAASWQDYWAVYAFGGLIGFATTIAEPALIAVTKKAQLVSGGTLSAWGLRIVVAFGVMVGIALGCFRIVNGSPLPAYIIVGYLVVSIQAFHAPRSILALAFDTGGVTTSTVTVPLVAALGLGLASHIPGRSPLVDGFGLIAFASLFPIMAVMGYAQIGQRRSRRRGAPQGRAAPARAPSPQVRTSQEA
jgi:hypothetical protein